MSQPFFFALSGAFFLLAPSPARAWDQHHLLTRHTLQGFERRDPELWRRLNEPVEARPIESFMRSAFGASCGWGGMRDAVLDGVGRDYVVRYAGGASYTLAVEYDKGITLASYRFQPGCPGIPGCGEQAPGKLVRPIDVMSIYSDEPDWQLDDDVPRLKDVAITQGIEGTGTRILRHFWYEGEKHFGVDMHEGQELDRRVRRYSELSQLAFSAGEAYWGWRFLGNAIHYLQDLTQPFHVLGFVHDEFIYKMDFVQAALCSRGGKKRKPADPPDPGCTSEETMERAKIKTGWLTGTYHSIYEDFGRGMLSTHRQGSPRFVADADLSLERGRPVEGLRFARDESGFLDARELVRQQQRIVLGFAPGVGEGLYRAFRHGYGLDASVAIAEVLRSGLPESIGQRYATTPDSELGLPRGMREAKALLVERTNALYQRAGAWGRGFTREALAPVAAEPLSKLRQRLKLGCEQAR